MNNEECAPKVDLQKDKLSKIEKECMERIQLQNINRVNKFRLLRRRNKLTGVALGLGVLSIYGYSMWAIKQESFLDDFEEPEKAKITA